MAKRWTCEHCGIENEERDQLSCPGCGLLRGSVVPAGSAGAPPPSPATPPSPPGTQWSSDPLIAEEAREWQAEQRSAQQRRGSGSPLTAVVLAILVVIWLYFLFSAVALTVDIVTTPDGGEGLLILPPMYCVLSAVGTVFIGAIVSTIWGAVLAAALLAVAWIFPIALFGDDISNWHPVAYAGAVLVALGTVFLLPVIAGIVGVLHFVYDWSLRGRLRGKSRAIGRPGP
jgi:hypothetical protein